MSDIKQTGRALLCLIVLLTTLGGYSNARASDTNVGIVRIRIGSDDAREALRRAYIEGMVIGYTPWRYDAEKGVLRLFLEEYYGPLHVSLYINVKLTMDEVSPLLILSGEEATFTGEESQVRSDMERVAAAVRACCGTGDQSR